MKTIYTINSLLKELEGEKNKQVGFVPTMGFLHAGHLSLVKEAKRDNDLVVMSIFVNPLQFGPNEDFDRYPRDEEADIHQAEQTGVDLLFIPSMEEMYPQQMQMSLTFLEGADVLCGRTRPGHFDGVAVVLSKLFHIIRPDRAYFGLKDAQQFALIHKMVDQFNFQVDLFGLPTVRESDGLAKSSRNVYLSDTERKEASMLRECLEEGRQSIKSGLVCVNDVILNVKDAIAEKLKHAVIDYVEVRTFPSLESKEMIDEQFILAAAVQYKKARLIDNIIMLPNGDKRAKIEMNHKTLR